MIKIGDKNLRSVSWEIAVTQARLARRRESIKSLNKFLKEDQEKLKELTESVKH